jgi:hypothetical protein
MMKSVSNRDALFEHTRMVLEGNESYCARSPLRVLTELSLNDRDALCQGIQPSLYIPVAFLH